MLLEPKYCLRAFEVGTLNEGNVSSTDRKKSYYCDKVLKNRPSKICGRQPLKHLKWYGLLTQTISLQIF